jgi:hypothetical protein
MTRLDLLLEKRTEYVNKLIEMNVWAANNPQASAQAAIEQIELELNSLDKRINKLRNWILFVLCRTSNDLVSNKLSVLQHMG